MVGGHDKDRPQRYRAIGGGGGGGARMWPADAPKGHVIDTWYSTAGVLKTVPKYLWT